MKTRPARASLIVVAITSLLAMAVFDHITGQELVFSCAYLLPASLCAWWFGRQSVIAMSLLSGLTAFVVDELDGYSYTHPGTSHLNAFTCFLIALIAGLLLARLKRTLVEREAANRELQRTLHELEASTAEIRKLQTGIQVVCAWTRRIQVHDRWMTPEEFLHTQLNITFTHGISPEAYDEIIAEVEKVA